MDKVYIVFQGADFDGQSLQGVFASRAAAEAKVAELLAEEAAELGGDHYLPRGEDEWAYCGYFIRIEQHSVA